MLKGFKDFVTGGNLIEVAVGLIMALALFALVQALIADLITPLIAAIFGEPDFGDLSFTINSSEFRYGDFVNALITFVSVAAAVYFFIVVPYQKYKSARGIGLGTKRCPECTMDMPEDARRCPHCTAQLASSSSPSRCPAPSAVSPTGPNGRTPLGRGGLHPLPVAPV